MSRSDFLADMRSAQTELLEILAKHDAGILAEAKVPGMDWTAKDVLAHLIGYDLGILAALKDIRAGRPFTWGWAASSFDAWNETNVGHRRSRPYAAVVAELESTRAALLRDLEDWPEDAGPFGAATWDSKTSKISWLVPHQREHAEMIATLGVAPAP